MRNFYIRLALSNVKKNKPVYYPFFLTNILSVMESSEGGLPAFFCAIVSPLFLVRTLIILPYAQKVNTFYDETQSLDYLLVHTSLFSILYLSFSITHFCKVLPLCRR